jgi:cytoskeletal protein RodZ
MTWHCPCGRRNRDNNDRCTKCEGPQNIPSWAKPKARISLPVRSGLLTVVIAGAAAFGMVHQSQAQVQYQTPAGDTVLPATASVNPILQPVDPGTGEGDTQPWTQYTSSSPTDLPTPNSPSQSSPDSPSSTPSPSPTLITEEPVTQETPENPVASVDDNGMAHSAPKPIRPSTADPTQAGEPDPNLRPKNNEDYGIPGEGDKIAAEADSGE